MSIERERRNHYRVLNVQPDAPLEIIRNNYRTLLQKLRLHPDLGGENHNASAINDAYHVLRDPVRRANYDKSLLRRYALSNLSQGHLLAPRNSKGKKAFAARKDRHGNRRNYYRILNLQPDSPEHVIKTAYLSLKKHRRMPQALLNEAYAVLSSQDKRALYDRLLYRYCHADAVGKLLAGKRSTVSQISRVGRGGLTAQSSGANRSRLAQQYGANTRRGYRPLISQYCSFCKTPHDQSPCEDTAPLCVECQSPLFPPSAAFLEQRRREIIRLAQRNGDCVFYTDWPGQKHHAEIADLSPLGIQLLTEMKLSKGQIIKVDADDFKAVGSVTHTHTDYLDGAFSHYAIGIKFLTVNFNRLKGQFFSASA